MIYNVQGRLIASGIINGAVTAATLSNISSAQMGSMPSGISAVAG